MPIIGYTYMADYHCPGCAMKAREAGKLAGAVADAMNLPAECVFLSLGGDPRGPCGFLRVAVPGPDGAPVWQRGDWWASDRGFPLY